MFMNDVVVGDKTTTDTHFLRHKKEEKEKKLRYFFPVRARNENNSDL